eukprot:IDg8831t1
MVCSAFNPVATRAPRRLPREQSRPVRARERRTGRAPNAHIIPACTLSLVRPPCKTKGESIAAAAHSGRRTTTR